MKASVSMESARADGGPPLLRAGRLARGVVYNLAGAAVPAVLGLLAIPLLAAGLGTARLGVLALAWTVLGYLAVMHFGVGRALTQAAGRGLGAGLAPTAWTALALTAGAGVMAGIALLLGAGPLAAALRLPPGLEREAASSFRVLSLALPFTVSAPALSGLLEARGRFGRLNLVTACVSAATYLGPLAALALGAGLPGVVGVLAAARAAGWMALAALCLREFPELRTAARPERGRAAELLRFGGWSTVSAVAGPVMAYTDRFVIAGALSASAVAFYATPQEVALRIGMLSGAVVGVFFPAFAAASAAVDAARMGRLLRGGWEAAFALVLVPALALAAFAGEGLRLWLGAEWSAAARWPLAWLAAGLLVNAIAKVIAALLLGVGRPDVPAKLHLVEVVLYLPLLFLLVHRFGITGAAAAWTARAAGDAAALLW
ncbi:MAG TPA: oligosaccharide flippase family protein, partial [Longimicrobium sp.]|nr:oligosaccharide flippase family protein [Longimicrobium sp.]